MFKLIDSILKQYRVCFKREETFSWFIITIFVILLIQDVREVSSIISVL